jgi:tetratricopeptide (TPR) repeat protein
VQRAGDRIRVTVQLIDANTDAHLWAENYDRELTAANIFAIQSEVATAIAAALKATLTADEKASVDAVPTQNLEAWEAYQLGKQRIEKRTSAGLADAERFFRNAIELDPKFALAHAGLANTFRLQVIYSGRSRPTALSEAERVAAKALELDPNLAEAWAAMGGIANQRGRFQEGEKFLRRAIELNPNYATAHHWLSTGLADNGRFQDALESAEVAIQLDPLSAVINSWFGLALTTVGHFDEAAIRYHKTIEIDPSMPGSYENLAYLNASALNRFAEAVKIQEKAAALDTGGPSIPAQLAQYYQNLGDESQAIRLLNQALARWPDDAYVNEAAAYVFESLADRERAGRHARKTLAAEPGSNVALEVLRNSDLRKGDYAAARARYETASPDLLASDVRVGVSNYYSAISLALVLQKMGDHEAAQMLLDRAEQTIRTLPRLGPAGHWIADVLIHALRGDKERALAALREAEQAGWRFGWRYYRDIDPSLASIRDDPEFKAVFSDIERDMARQRAELAARPKDTPLALEMH